MRERSRFNLEGHMSRPYKIICGIQTYVKRRSYGQGVMYSWIQVENGDGEMMTLGDPWKCINPPIKEVERELSFYVDGDLRRKEVIPI